MPFLNYAESFSFSSNIFVVVFQLIKIVEKPKMMQPEKPVAVSTSIPIENGQEDDGANTDEDPIEWQVGIIVVIIVI